ncbi:NUDIX domain protein [Brucella rhizosphaerae]|uniref:NUDIX domain protein n=2 Tax=Brucella rhizosphaerae TaxID=571254 RepID=A0A256FDM4_9HYPH|nr:NUDIX domain protein [Brucella rhizosphaerae]
MTLGVRAIVFDEEKNSVFLVKHTYVPGWQLPGGGVDSGETFGQALEKELREEGNIRLTGKPELFALYKNAHASPRDHVALYVCRDFEQTEPKKRDREIAEAGFFPLDNLPEGTTSSTKRRLQEALHDLDPLPTW